MSPKNKERGKTKIEFLQKIILEGKFRLEEHVLHKLTSFHDEIKDKNKFQKFLSAINYVRFFYKDQGGDASCL